MGDNDCRLAPMLHEGSWLLDKKRKKDKPTKSPLSKVISLIIEWCEIVISATALTNFKKQHGPFPQPKVEGLLQLLRETH